MTLAIDYAWQHPDPAAIKADGYDVVMRYLSHDSSKDLTAAEAVALHSAGLSIGLVWETTARRAADGFNAGVADAREANARADELGFPKGCPLFYAVDYDAEPSVASAYFNGIATVAGRPIGVYGSYRVVEQMLSEHALYGWQATAWSYDVEQHRVMVSHKAHLFQRMHRTLAPLAGVRDSAWDENAVLALFPLWEPNSPAQPTPPPARLPGTPVSRSNHRAPLPRPAGPGLAVDGRMGPKTVTALQQALHVPADGKFGPVTAEALQRHIGAHPDGDVGPITVTDLQRHVRAHVDGIWPSVKRPHTVDPNVVSDTTTHLQLALNGHKF